MIKKYSFLLAAICLSTFTGCVTTSTTPNEISNTGSTQAADANIQLAMNYLESNKMEDAKQKLLAALKIAPNYPASWYSMAYYYQVTGDNQRANQYYLHALALAPNSGDTNNNYGTFLCQTGQTQAAINRFIIAAQDSNYVDTAAAYENAGLCALRIPNLKLAQIYFTQAVTQDPSRVTSLTDLAAICYKNKDYKAAYKYLNQLFQNAAPTPNTLLLAAQTANALHLDSDVIYYTQQLQARFPNAPENKLARALL